MHKITKKIYFIILCLSTFVLSARGAYYDDRLMIYIDNKVSDFRIEDNQLKTSIPDINNTLNIICEKDITKIEIYDALGRIIISKENPSNHISVEELKSGLYTISVTFKDNKIVRKFQK